MQAQEIPENKAYSLTPPVTVPTRKPSSSYCPDFSQIPIDAMFALAQRYELGAKKHGKDNWKAGLTDPQYVVERLNHVIYHVKKLQDKIEGRMPWDGDDDPGAILWGGAFAVEAIKALGHGDKIDRRADV